MVAEENHSDVDSDSESDHYESKSSNQKINQNQNQNQHQNDSLPPPYEPIATPITPSPATQFDDLAARFAALQKRN